MGIRNIIRESIKLREEFGWIDDIQPDTDLEIGQLWLRSDGFDSHNGPFFAKQFDNIFNDIELRGDKLYLITDGLCDFTDLFVDNDSSQYNYINKWLAEQIFCDDGDYWEPYYDVVHDWGNQVWEMVMNNTELYKYISNHIKEGGYVGKELSTSDEFEDPENEGFRIDMLKDKVLMEELIEHDDLFDDLKNELTWAYESAYNTAARDEIWVSAKGVISDAFGNSEWESKVIRKLDGEVTRHLLVFDVTSIIFDVVGEFLDGCFESCRSYHTRYGDDDQTFEEYCEECWEIEYGDFIDLYKEYLDDYSELFNPSFSEWPNDDKLAEYFEEDVYSRI